MFKQTWSHLQEEYIISKRGKKRPNLFNHDPLPDEIPAPLSDAMLRQPARLGQKPHGRAQRELRASATGRPT